MVYNSCLEVPYYAPDKGKPLERVGRKATGLRPADAGYGRRAPGRLPCLLVEARRARAHQQEGCAYANLVDAFHVFPRLLCHRTPRVAPTTRSGSIGLARPRTAWVLHERYRPSPRVVGTRHHGSPRSRWWWASWGCLHAGKQCGGRRGRWAAPPHLSPMINDPPMAGQTPRETGSAITAPAMGFVGGSTYGKDHLYPVD